MEYDEFRAMNTRVVLAASGTEAGRAFAAARAFIDESEARFSRFLETSELVQLNRSAGKWFAASGDLYQVVQEARRLTEETDGLFDPSILTVLEGLGYDRSLEDIGAGQAVRRMPIVDGGSGGLLAADFDASARAIRLPAGTRLDLGGIAKGWIAEQAALRMATYAPACAVNAGGDLYLHGQPDSERGWRLAVEDPRDEDHVLAVLQVPSGAVATSSTVRRRWRQGGIERHHLIDPRTGLPSSSEWLSVTVLAPHASTAEAFATALLIAGASGAAQLIEAGSDLAYLAVDADGDVWGTASAREWVWDGMERF
jgi:thiamine biosynthesis lipoprotein